MSEENENLKEAENSVLNISDVIRCLSPEIESMHYQSRDRNQCYLQLLLTEAKGKGNLAMELIYALEKHLNTTLGVWGKDYPSLLIPKEVVLYA